MGKIGIIIWREFSVKVRKKSFIVMSILGPVLTAAFMTLLIWLPNADKIEHKIIIVDDSYIIRTSKLSDNDFVQFSYSDKSFDETRKTFYKTDYTCLLYIPNNVISGGGAVQLYFKKSPGFSTENYVKSQLEARFYEVKLATNRIDPNIIKNARAPLKLITAKLDEKGNSIETKNENLMWIGFAAGMLIFMFVLMYGMQVLRSVMEEKNNRIVEVIVSSVKPFQLMIGKIIGVALVGLTQFLLWIIFSVTLTAIASVLFLQDVVQDVKKFNNQQEIVYKQGSNANMQEMEKIDSKLGAVQMVQDLASLNFAKIIVCFGIYFLGGFFLYSALFAAIGSAVDSDADTQQFLTPVMMPLMLGYMMSIYFIQNPQGDLAFWASVIPFTSPIAMMVRLPFDPPMWQLVLSIVLLIAGFLFTTWLAARIYRTGILMYGKKVSWRELGKWVFYK